MTDLSRFRSQPGVGHTPWQVQADMPFAFSDSNGVPIGECFGNTPSGRAQAKAAFIVRACNAHDELVAVLTEIESVARLTVTADHTHCVMAINLITDRARAALAKTES